MITSSALRQCPANRGCLRLIVLEIGGGLIHNCFLCRVPVPVEEVCISFIQSFLIFLC